METVGDWKNEIYHEPISERVTIWKRIVDRKVLPFPRFYIACSDNKLPVILDYIAKKLDVSKDNIITVAAPQTYIHGIREQLSDMKDQIAATSGKRIIVIVNGFEKYFDSRVTPREQLDIGRVGHHYDQAIGENPKLREMYAGVDKQIIVITHIGQSQGEQAYQDATASACGSHFSDGIIEVAAQKWQTREFNL